MERSRLKGLDRLAEVLIMAGVVLSATAPFVLAIEISEWLTNMEWPGWSVEDGLGLFGIDRGETPETAAQQLVDVLMAVPLTLALFLTGVAMFMLGIRIGDWTLDSQRKLDLWLSDD